MPTVSIITPCYNFECFVGETIRSVRQQSFQDWEHLIVDDNSTDGSRQVIESHIKKEPRCRLIALSANRGASYARNAGYRASSESRYLLFLDADDCLYPRMLEKLVSYCDARPDVGLARCDYEFIDAQSRPAQARKSNARYIPSGLWVRDLSPEEPETPFASVLMCAIIPSIALLRRSVYEKTPGFDDSFGEYRVETDLFLWIALRSKIHFVPETLVKRRFHTEQCTASSKSFQQWTVLQDQKLYSKWRSAEGLGEEEKKIVRAAWRFKEERIEPYLDFRRAARDWKQKKWTKALRYSLGGIRRWLASFLP